MHLYGKKKMIKLSCQGAFLNAKMRAFMQKLKFLMQRCKLSYKNVRFNIKMQRLK